ncbi:MAG: hypothetical protein RIR26_1852, partial [Pseudomonadota bacterium]
MKTVMTEHRTFTFIAMLVCILSTGCKGRTKTSSAQNPPISGTPKGGIGPDAKIIPPVPVIGTFLTAELLEKDGTPLANATVNVMEKESEESDASSLDSLWLWVSELLGQTSVYETKANERGLFKVPVENIKSSKINLQIRTKKRFLTSEISIPADIAAAVSNARVSAGLPPLPDLPPSAGAFSPISERKLGLQIPENRNQPPTTGSISEPLEESVFIMTSSLPLPTDAQGKSFGMWTLVENESSASAARFYWNNMFSKTAEVKIVFAQDSAILSNWDGRQESTPLWQGKQAGDNIVSDFSQCSDESFNSQSSGPLTSVDGSSCGLSRAVFPFNAGGDVFFRLVGATDSEIRLSPVFSILAGNNVPQLALPASVETNEDTPLSNLSVRISDSESPLLCTSSLSFRSTNSQLLPSANIFLTGQAPDCTLTLLPAPNKSGLSAVVVTLSDGSLTEQKVLQFKVNPVNDVPFVSDVPNQSTKEDEPLIDIPFLIGDADGPLSCPGNVAVSSSNATVLPQENVILGGFYPNCTLSLVPKANQSGSATVTLQVNDGNASAQDSFELNVQAVADDAPTLFEIASPQVMTEDTAKTIAFTAGDPDTALSCSTSYLSYTASNSSLVAASGAVVWGGSWPNCSGTITPVANMSGVSKIEFIITDGTLSTLRSFTLSVTPQNDAPTLSGAPASQSTAEDTPALITFTADDPDGSLTCSAEFLSYTSSDSNVVAASGAVFWGGTWPNCNATVVPVSNAFGTTNLTLKISDSLATAETVVALSVTAANDAPTISNLASPQITNEDTNTEISFLAGDVDGALTCSSANFSY